MKQTRGAAVVIGVLIVALVVLGFSTKGLSRARSRFEVPGAPLGLAGLVLPVVNPSAIKTAWYCVTPPISSGVTKSSVVVTNVTSKAIELESGRTVTKLSKHSSLKGFGEQVVMTGAKSGSGIVVVSKGGTLASVVAATAEGTESMPCESSPYGSWILPSQDTSLGSSATLSMYNPYPTPAVVDITVLGASGSEVVPAGAGIVLEPGHSDAVKVASLIPNTANSSLIVTIRSGRAVVGDIVSRGGWHSLIEPVALANSFAEVPDVMAGAGVQVRADLTNPTSQTERVNLGVSNYHGAQGTFEVERHSKVRRVVLGPDSTQQVNLTSKADLGGVPLIRVTAHATDGGSVVLAVSRASSTQGSFSVLEGMSEGSRSWWLSCQSALSHRTMVAFTHIPSVGDLLGVSSHAVGSHRLAAKFLANILEPGVVTVPVRLTGAVLFHATLAAPAFLAPVGTSSSCTSVLGD